MNLGFNFVKISNFLFILKEKLGKQKTSVSVKKAVISGDLLWWHLFDKRSTCQMHVKLDPCAFSFLSKEVEPQFCCSGGGADSWVCTMFVRNKWQLTQYLRVWNPLEGFAGCRCSPHPPAPAHGGLIPSLCLLSRPLIWHAMWLNGTG